MLFDSFLSLVWDGSILCRFVEAYSVTQQTMTGPPICMALSDHRSLNSLKLMHLACGAHCVFNLKVHLIFVVAYRRKVISAKILSRLDETFSERLYAFRGKAT